MHTVSRLIERFQPNHYALSLNLQRKERKFSGIVTIEGLAVEGASAISLHAKDLHISTVTLDGKTATWKAGENDEINVDRPSTNESTHTLVVAFDGTITDGMHGLYPCYYEHGGIKKELLATQFESHHAREVFPCIDEPAAKATFDVTLTTESDITVLGNMPVRQQSVEDGQLITRFDRTPRMSTYLLAWVTGELHSKTAHTKDGVEVNIWATPAQPVESLDFALDIAVRSIEFYNDFFGTAYPLPKSDHVALPDFSSGAMENWGLITYREVALLADPAVTSIDSKRYIATVIAHELAHQWFGNLVTMKWWNDLWLNESFATLMEYLAVDALQPDWDVWLEFSNSESIMALRRDAIDGVQAVQVDVNHPDEISTLFDGAIVYAKGARLLRMLQYFIGNNAFQTGLREYFTLHAYKNTEGNDLWVALGRASGKDIASLMNTWISQSGYPVVSVNQTGETVELTQQQFFVGPHQPSSKLWPIPLGSPTSGMPSILDTASATVTIQQDAAPVRLNNADAAHFITRYSPDLLERLIEAVKADQLDIITRLQLLHEQTMLVRGEGGDSSSLINLLDAYKHETAEPVWNIISLAIGELKKFVEKTDEEPLLRTLAGQIARDLYDKLGWDAREGEPEDDTRLRPLIIGMMIYSEDSGAIAEALRRYESTPLDALNPELRSVILTGAVRHGAPEIVDTLLAAHKASNSAELQQDIVSAVTSSKNPTVLSHLLELMKDESIVRHQDVFRWFVGIIRNRDGRDLAWAWVQDNWDWVVATFRGDKSYDDFPRYSASGLVTREQLEQYRSFFGPMQSEPALARVITMGISEIEGRVELIERDSEKVRAALRNLA